jgi:thioredoxin 2
MLIACEPLPVLENLMPVKARLCQRGTIRYQVLWGYDRDNSCCVPPQRHDCGVCHLPLFDGRPVVLDNSARFDKHAKHSDIPLLSDFWAMWCGPCRTMAPTFEQVAAQLEPDVRLIRINSEAAPELLQRFSIHSIPTVLVIHHGREVACTTGAVASSELVAWTLPLLENHYVTFAL